GGSDAGGGGLPGGAAKGSQQLSSLPQDPRSHHTAKLGARSDGQERLSQPRGGRGGQGQAFASEPAPLWSTHIRCRVLRRGGAPDVARPVWRGQTLRWRTFGAHHTRSRVAAARAQSFDRRPRRV